MPTHKSLPKGWENTVVAALQEDIADGDRNAALIAEHTQASAKLLLRETAVLAGVAWFEQAFKQLCPAVVIDWQAQEGELVAANTVVCTVQGPARALLTAERTAINFLQMLSGVATSTRRYVDAVAGTQAAIVDTRKTIPGLRHAQKYAVLCGGGVNHRMGLYDAILIKENHIIAAGGIGQAVATARQQSPELTVQVEVENLDELTQALAAGVDSVLLDNFSHELLIQGVQQVQLHNQKTGQRVTTEASGDINLDTVQAAAQAGVDRISIGGLTKHVRATDFSLRLQFA